MKLLKKIFSVMIKLFQKKFLVLKNLYKRQLINKLKLILKNLK